MSIINLKETFENGQTVYFNIDNKIIECTCLTKVTKIIKFFVADYIEDCIDFESFICNKVKVIKIYDIYKNILHEPTRPDSLGYLIKVGKILINLKERHIYFFKTFTEAYIQNSKFNCMKYYMDNTIILNKFLYYNIKLIINNFTKTFTIYDNEGICIHMFKYRKYTINYKNYNDEIRYNFYDNYIKIKKGDYEFNRTISFYKKNLKIFEIYKYCENIEDICEKRNDNNEIIYLLKLDKKNKIKEKFTSNNINPPFSKPLRKDCIELLDYYKKNINNYTELIKPFLKKDKEVQNNLLLNCKLEMINSK